MGVTLAKGGNVSLSKAAPNLTRVLIGLGWDARSTTGADFDLDASALMCSGGRVMGDEWFVFYNQLKSPDGSVEHTGDNLTGEGEGDDEQIRVDLSRVPQNVKTLVFVVNSFTGQDFGRIENAFCRLVDETTGAEIARYNLSGGGSHTAQVMAKVYRGSDGGWDMSAIGENASGRTFRDLMPAITASL